MRTIELRYFASVRELIGTGQETHASAALTEAELRQELCAKSPRHAEALGASKRVRAAVNQVMVMPGDALPTGPAEVAFFPPVTGG